MVKEFITSLRASYMLQTADDPPAYIVVKTNGWLTGSKEVLEKLNDPSVADAVNPGSYKYRVHLSMETGDERYATLNTSMWIASGCRRSQEGLMPALQSPKTTCPEANTDQQRSNF